METFNTFHDRWKLLFVWHCSFLFSLMIRNIKREYYSLAERVVSFDKAPKRICHSVLDSYKLVLNNRLLKKNRKKCVHYFMTCWKWFFRLYIARSKMHTSIYVALYSIKPFNLNVNPWFALRVGTFQHYNPGNKSCNLIVLCTLKEKHVENTLEEKQHPCADRVMFAKERNVLTEVRNARFSEIRY